MTDTTIDKITGTARGGTKRTTIDDLFEERQVRAVQKVREMEAKKVELEQRKELLQAERDVQRLERDESGGSGADVNAEMQLVRQFVKDGMEIGKATEMISKMDPTQRIQLQMLAQTRGGAAYLAPWLAVARQPDTSVEQAIKLMEKANDMALKNQPQGQQPLSIHDVIMLFDKMKPGEETNSQMAYLNDKLEKMEVKLEAEREDRHRQEVAHRDEIAKLRQENIDAQLKQLSGKLEEVTKTKEDPLEYFKKAKETLKEVGVPIGEGAVKSPLEEANTLIKTVVESPGMNKVFDATSARIREGGFSRGAGGGAPVAAAALTSGQQILCDNCLAQGRRTVLPITAGVIAGTESVTCPVCKVTFRKGGAPPGSPPSGSPPPSPPRFPPGSFGGL